MRLTQSRTISVIKLAQKILAMRLPTHLKSVCYHRTTGSQWCVYFHGAGHSHSIDNEFFSYEDQSILTCYSEAEARRTARLLAFESQSQYKGHNKQFDWLSQ